MEAEKGIQITANKETGTFVLQQQRTVLRQQPKQDWKWIHSQNLQIEVSSVDTVLGFWNHG